MSTKAIIPFGEALRGYRLAAGLTQESVAERAGVSARTVQALEQGENTPRSDTADRLATALGLGAAERARFVALALPVPRRRLPARPAPPSTGAPGGSPARQHVPHNLPSHLTSFVGREHELAEIARLLSAAPAPCRLLTLMGTGGVGKSRLALQAAAGLLDRYPHGAWLVELAALDDPASVPRAVATVLGVREEAGRPVMAALIDALRPRHLLLVLDNCEHLVAACAALAETVLRACPQLQILATSREALGIAGEVARRVPSLELPEPSPGPSLQSLARCEAVRLLGDRILATEPRFVVTEQNAGAVVQICRRLDGIPLALELAAARVQGLGVQQVAARLDQRFRLLTAGSRTALPRHQTLQATVDWSYGLLSPREQTLFARLSVFAGGFTLEAAEMVCQGGAIAAGEVLDLLVRLVGKSLVIVEQDATGDARYGLLETLRQYGRERLMACRDAMPVHGGHAAFYLALAEEAEEGLHGPAQPAWLDRLEVEHENLRGAAGWLVANGETEQAARLAGALLLFWEVRGHRRQGRDLLEAVLSAPGAAGPGRAKALQAAGMLAHFDGDDAVAQVALEESLAIALKLGDPHSTGTALMGLGWYATDRGDFEIGRRLAAEALAAQRAAGDTWGSAWALTVLAWGALRQGDAGAARALHEEALAIRRALGDRQGIEFTLQGLADVCRAKGDLDGAIALVEEGLAIQRALGVRPSIRWSLYNLGIIALRQGDEETAHARLAESLRLSQELGDRQSMALFLLKDVAGLLAPTQPARALRLAGAASALRASLGRPLTPPEQTQWEHGLESMRAALDEGVAAAAWAAGQALTLEQAVAEALGT